MNVVLLLMGLCSLCPPEPTEEDLECFPDAKVCEEMISFNRDVYRHCVCWEYLDTWKYTAGEWKEFRYGLDDRHSAWYNLKWAHIEKSYDQKSFHLKKLRDIIGLNAYYQGIMPLSVPLEFFWDD